MLGKKKGRYFWNERGYLCSSATAMDGDIFFNSLESVLGKDQCKTCQNRVLRRLRLKLQEDIYTNVFDYAVCKEYCIATIGEFITECDWNII